jgi:hypothetical protein
MSNYSNVSAIGSVSGAGSSVFVRAASTLLLVLTIASSGIADQSTIIGPSADVQQPKISASTSTQPVIPAYVTASILQRLDALLNDFPAMRSQITDAGRFALTLPSTIAMPQIWTDGETEVAFEWISGAKHAAVTFEGDGGYGYATRQGAQFIPGDVTGKIGGSPPEDLFNYIA